MTDSPYQVWPLARVLADVQCGSDDWPWEKEWADLDERDAEALAVLEQDITKRGILEPLLIGNDGRLWDGHHRLRIAVRLGIGYLPVELTAPTEARGSQEAEQLWNGRWPAPEPPLPGPPPGATTR